MSKSTFELSRVSGQPVADIDLLDDIRRVAELLGLPSVSRPQYMKHGKFGATIAHTRFGSWNKSLIAAGLPLIHENSISDERLFENLLILWQHFGRQPRRNELMHEASEFSQHPYNRRFGSWTAALAAFINYANGSAIDVPDTRVKYTPLRSTGRDPSLRLRWHVLQRDHFKCCTCGKSPAVTLGVELHVDHIVPWSKGGETVLENLRTLCSKCNLGKGNVSS